MSYSVRWPSAISQQGTPCGLRTLLNQDRIWSGTSLYWPLSKADAAYGWLDRAAINNPRMMMRMLIGPRMCWPRFGEPESYASGRAQAAAVPGGAVTDAAYAG